MTEFTLRPATIEDIPALINHRRRMFEDMAHINGEMINPLALDEMDKAHQIYLSDHFADGSLHAWLIQVGSVVVAGACITVIKGFPPHYTNLKGEVPYLHDVYTHPDFRRQGFARLVVQEAINFCRACQYTFLKLHASQEGHPLYASLGFKVTNEMRLNF